MGEVPFSLVHTLSQNSESTSCTRREQSEAIQTDEKNAHNSLSAFNQCLINSHKTTADCCYMLQVLHLKEVNEQFSFKETISNQEITPYKYFEWRDLEHFPNLSAHTSGMWNNWPCSYTTLLQSYHWFLRSSISGNIKCNLILFTTLVLPILYWAPV